MITGKRVLVCGGRDFSDTKALGSALRSVEPLCIIQGGARGADYLAATWGRSNGVPVIQVDAQWHRYGKKAGYLRNRWMLDLCAPELILAFPGGNGTKMMVALAVEAGLPVMTPLEFGDGFTPSDSGIEARQGGDKGTLGSIHESPGAAISGNRPASTAHRREGE